MLDLRRYAHGAGCGLKLSGAQLEEMLARVRLASNEAYPVLFGVGAQYDYGAVNIDEKSLLVQSVDMIAPVCESAYTFGEIVVAHTLSDIYVAGASPFCALAILVLPDSNLPLEGASELMESISARLQEEGCFLLGGHTLRTGETLLAGLAVTGTTSRRRLIGPRGALPGDILITTKALGTGLYIAADRQNQAGLDFQTAIDSMRKTNRCMLALQEQIMVHAAVDISGFGLLEALYRISNHSNVGVAIDFESLPLFPQAKVLAQLGYHTRLTDHNSFFTHEVLSNKDLTMADLAILNDPQTSGGILLAISPEEASKALDLCHSIGATDAKRVGACSYGGTIAKITVQP